MLAKTIMREEGDARLGLASVDRYKMRAISRSRGGNS
jgi:hypothetical protein